MRATRRRERTLASFVPQRLFNAPASSFLLALAFLAPLSRLLTAVVMSSLVIVVSIGGEAHASTPQASELVKLNGRIAKASGIRVITTVGVFEGRGAWVDSVGLHLAGTHRRFDASEGIGPEVLPWGQASEIRIRRSHAREGAWVLGSLGAVLYGVAGAFGAGFADHPSTGLTVGYVAAGIVVGGTLGAAVGGLLGWGTHGWKTIWKDGRLMK